eukprot:scaffold13160_cov140-Skeletonema_dohrnii-CCMP3373.AAC.1
MLEPCKTCFYTIMTNYNSLLDAVDYHSHSVRYDMALESRAGSHLRWPHQVAYDVVATPIRPKNA